MKKLVELCVDGAKVIDICIEGDKLVEQGTGAVYNKLVKGVKVNKGGFHFSVVSWIPPHFLNRGKFPRLGFSHQRVCEQRSGPFFTPGVC
jgi:hypothetical protein